MHPVEIHFAAVDLVVPADQYKQDGLAASALTKDADKLAIRHLEPDGFDYMMGLVSLLVALAQTLDAQGWLFIGLNFLIYFPVGLSMKPGFIHDSILPAGGITGYSLYIAEIRSE